MPSSVKRWSDISIAGSQHTVNRNAADYSQIYCVLYLLLEHTSSNASPDTLCSLIAAIKLMYQYKEHEYICHAFVGAWVCSRLVSGMAWHCLCLVSGIRPSDQGWRL